ncbi:MAG: hypothetical protein H7301_06875 [Cryobacterium sp.]|nr:hypothetical protein [Oligoflexia bacterium]
MSNPFTPKMKRTSSALIAAFSSLSLSLILSGCGLGLTNGFLTAEPQTYSLNGVKWISASVTDGSDPQTMTQSDYSISSSDRLLLRFEELGEKTDQISLTSGRKIELLMSLTEAEDGKNAVAHLKVCPLTKNWMMLATWSSAYPMGSSGDWSKDGGDFTESECVRPPALAAATDQPILLHFDITRSFTSNVKGRGENFGFVLTSDQPVAIHVLGDLNPSHSPRISWTRSPF